MKWTPEWDLSTIPKKRFFAELGRRLNKNRAPESRKGGRPKVLRVCPQCNQEFSGREWQRHRCDGKES